MIKTRDELKIYLDNTKKETIILKFTATWCGPCKQIAPLVTNLNNHYTQQNIALTDLAKRVGPITEPKANQSAQLAIYFPSFFFVFNIG